MSVLALIFGIAVLMMCGIRGLRWLALLQQKEYRLDRLFLFLRSREGLSELFRLMPHKVDSTRTGLKRPKLTARILVVALFSGVVSAYLLLQALLTPLWYEQLFILGLLYIALPFIILLSAIPSAVIAAWKTEVMLRDAREVLAVKQPLIIGITGSYGKSSTKHLLSHILSKKYTVFVTPKSFNTRFSVAQSIAQHYKNQSVAILEYGAYGVHEIARLASWFRPTIAVITGLTQQHVGLFGTLNDIISAKAELIEALSDKGVVFYNDANSQVKKIITRGLEQRVKQKSSKVEVTPAAKDSVAARLHTPTLTKEGKLTFMWDKKRVETKLVGSHYFEIVRVAVAVARYLDVPEPLMREAVESFVPGSTFITTYALNNGARVIDDGGTSNPQGFAAALQILEESDMNNVVLITPGIIDLGKEEHAIHQSLATLASKRCDTLLHVGTAGARAFKQQFDSSYAVDQEQIIAKLELLGPKSVLLIEGKMPGWVEMWMRQHRS